MNGSKALPVAAVAIGVAAALIAAERVLPAPDHPHRKPKPINWRAEGWDDEHGPG